MHMRKWIWVVAVVLITAAGGIWLLARPKSGNDKVNESYELATVTRGSVESVVTSSGTLSAVATVSILVLPPGRSLPISLRSDLPGGWLARARRRDTVTART